MNKNEKKASYRVLVSITTPKLADKAAEMFILDNVPLQYESVAVGTAPNEMIDVLGLGNPDKVFLAAFLSKTVADSMLRKMKKELKLGTVNSGIAFTMPLTGASGILVHMLEEFEKHWEDTSERKVNLQMSDTKYYLIAAVVNQGYSETVMDAARKAGAGGGTVIPGRSIVTETAVGFWGSNIQDEKETVMIVAPDENRKEIMEAVSTACGVKSEAKGVVVSFPIDNVIGIE